MIAVSTACFHWANRYVHTDRSSAQLDLSGYNCKMVFIPCMSLLERGVKRRQVSELIKIFLKLPFSFLQRQPRHPIQQLTIEIFTRYGEVNIALLRSSRKRIHCRRIDVWLRRRSQKKSPMGFGNRIVRALGDVSEDVRERISRHVGCVNEPESASLCTTNADGTKWELVPSLSDEFTNCSTLDASKWLPHDPQWKGRPPGWFSPQNVFVEDHALNLVCRYEQPPKCEPEEFKVIFRFSLCMANMQHVLDFSCICFAANFW